MMPHLHVGAIIDSPTPAAWVVDLLQRLLARPQILLTVAHADTSTVGNKQTGGVHPQREKLIKRVSRWWLMHKIDSPLFDHDPCSPTSLPSGVAVLKLSSQQDTLSDCDILLNLCAGNITDLISVNSNAPCWSAQIETLHVRAEYHLLNAAPVMWLHLWDIRKNQLSANHDNACIASHALPRYTFSLTDLKRLFFCSLPSLFESRLVWFAKNWQAGSVVELQQPDQSVFPDERAAARTDALRWQTATQTAQTSQSLPFTTLVARLFWRRSVERIRAKFYEEHWQLAAVGQTSSEPLSVNLLAQTPVSDYKDLAITEDVIWADPHTQEYNGEYYVFFEKMLKHDKQAHIAVARLNSDGQLGESYSALKEDCHLSYPFVFEADGAHYMIPETASQQCIRLYKAREFPHDWMHIGDLLNNTDSADTTLLRHNNRWWMFSNRQSHRCVDERDELHIHMADDLLGPWQAHPLNPVLTGVDRARMAGPIITEAGMHYRVSQYGAKRYGRGINISRIDELSPDNYQETALHRLQPESESRWQGCHTLGFAKGLTIIDRVRYRLR